MKCQDRRDLMLLYLVDALDPAEQALLRDHLARGCPTCLGYLAEAEATLAHLPLMLEPVDPSPGVRQRLMARIAAHPRPQQDAESEHASALAQDPPRPENPAPTKLKLAGQGPTTQLSPPPPPGHPDASYRTRTGIGRWGAPLAAALLGALCTYGLIALPAQRSNTQLSQQLAQTQQRSSQLASQKTRLQDNLHRLTDQHQQLQAQRDELAAGLEHLNTQHTQLALQRDALKSENQDLAAQADQWAGKISQARQLNEKLAASNTHLETMNNQLTVQLREMKGLRAQLVVKNEEIDRLATRLEQANQTVRMVRSSALKVASLQGGQPQPAARGRVFWDVEARRWHFFADGLAAPEVGKTYELWFITPDQRKIPAGTFDVDPAGRGSLVVDLPPGVDELALAAVTDEPIGGVEQPTGQIQLAGKLE